MNIKSISVHDSSILRLFVGQRVHFNGCYWRVVAVETAKDGWYDVEMVEEPGK